MGSGSNKSSLDTDSPESCDPSDPSANPLATLVVTDNSTLGRFHFPDDLPGGSGVDSARCRFPFFFDDFDDFDNFDGFEVTECTPSDLSDLLGLSLCFMSFLDLNLTPSFFDRFGE